MKTCTPQALSCILSNFTGEFFSFDLRDVVNLSTKFFIRRFFAFFYFFHKNTFFKVFFILGVNVLYIYDQRRILQWRALIEVVAETQGISDVGLFDNRQIDVCQS